MSATLSRYWNRTVLSCHNHQPASLVPVSWLAQNCAPTGSIVLGKRRFRSGWVGRAYVGHIGMSCHTGVPRRCCYGTSAGILPELEALYNGNRQFRDTILATNPGLLRALAEDGQRPQFMFLDCSDSRVCEQSIFSAQPGTMFTTANIANQYKEDDLSANAVLSFAVNDVDVKHIVVMGHYGCGGIAAALMAPPVGVTDTVDPVQSWVLPIREIYQRSTRKEIVEHRAKVNSKDRSGAAEPVPHARDPAFRALVEENVKANVQRVAKSAVIATRYAALTSLKPSENSKTIPVDVFIHGWVYDIETGEVMDVNVSVAPPGKKVPKTPFRILPAE